MAITPTGNQGNLRERFQDVDVDLDIRLARADEIPQRVQLAFERFFEVLANRPHFMPRHLAPFVHNDTARLAHDTLSVFHRQLTERFIAMRTYAATLGDEQAKRIYIVESKKEMLQIIKGMETTLQGVPPFERFHEFHESYEQTMKPLIENVKDLDSDDDSEDEINDGGPAPVPNIERRIETVKSRFEGIPPEIDEAIQSFLPLTDRMRGARVSQAFHQGAQSFVPELFYQNISEFNDFYCRLWHTFGPSARIGDNEFTWEEYADHYTNVGYYSLRGSCAQDIQLNNEKMAWKCATIMSNLMEMEAREEYNNEVRPAIERIINELAPSVSAPFQKIMGESLEIANLIRTLIKDSEKPPEVWQSITTFLTDAHRYSHAMFVANRSPERAAEYSCEVIRRTAVSDRKLATLLASRFLFMQCDFEAIVKIVQAWPDETHAAFKNEWLLQIHDRLVERKRIRVQLNEALLLDIQQYLKERNVPVPSIEPIESKEAEPEEAWPEAEPEAWPELEESWSAALGEEVD